MLTFLQFGPPGVLFRSRNVFAVLSAVVAFTVAAVFLSPILAIAIPDEPSIGIDAALVRDLIFWISIAMTWAALISARDLFMPASTADVRGCADVR